MDKRSTLSQGAALVAWLAITFAAAGLGAIGSLDAPEFYLSLERPSWAPPSRVFGPVWTVLYALMGVAAWLVWRQPRTEQSTAALVLFLVQLVFNALWSWIFFVYRAGGWAFADILVLLLLVIATCVAFAKIRPLAGWLLAPYLAWVAFATALTWSVWRRNPTLL